jgi:hypothetical protein
MPIGNYADTAQLAIILPSANSTILSASNEYVSRLIDSACNRHFYSETADKVFDACHQQEIIIDDLIPGEETTVSLDGAELDEGQFEFFPLNETPKTSIKLIGVHGDRIGIHGTWGYATTVPASVVHVATVLTRIDYQNTMDRGATSKRLGNASINYAELEQSTPTVKLISPLVCKFKRVS